MATLALDTETAIKYDGTNAEEILNNTSPEIKQHIQTNGWKLWNYYPVLNATKPVLGCIIEQGKKKTQWFNLEKEPNSMWNYLLKRIQAEGQRGKSTEIWALNHTFDLSAYGRTHLYDKEFQTISYNPFIHAINTTNGTGKLLELANFYPKMKLEKIAQIIGLQKGKLLPTFQNINELKTYCEQDTKIVLKAVQTLREKLQQMGYKPKRLTTTPRLANSIFQYELKKTKHTTPEGKTYSMAGYWYNQGKIHQTQYPEQLQQACRGGRIEMFTLNQTPIENVTKIDIKSCYPYVASNNPFPDIAKEKYWNKPTTDCLTEIGITEITLKAPLTNLPYLPIRYNKKVIYPTNCTIRGYWTNFEINKALKEGYEIIQIHQSITYPTLPFNPFQKFYQKFYNARQNADEAMKHFCKLLMNGLTGRFAYQTKSQQIKKIPITEIQNTNLEEWKIIAETGDAHVIIQQNTQKKYAKTSHPAIYAHITAYARDHLYNEMKKIPFEDLLYCVTDSIIFKGNHIEKFKIGNELGDWTIEETGTGQFWNEHYYRINQNIKASGTRKQDVSIDAIEGKTPLITKNMNSIKNAMKKNNIENAGTFYNKEMHLKRTPKRLTKYPEYIQEFTQTQQKNIIEQLMQNTENTENTT